MLKPPVMGADWKFAMMILAEVWVFAAVSVSPANASQTAITAPHSQSPEAATPFIPPSFKVPTLVETEKFKLVPLGPDLVKVDFDAYMSSIDHLQKTFTRSTAWPHQNISDADAMQDMQTEQARFTNRISFAYAVLTPEGQRERGSVYVSPSPVKGYDAVVRMWVTKNDYDAGFDAELYDWVVNWVQKVWPFAKIAYPGRSIEWSAWDAMVAKDRLSEGK